MAEIKSEKSEKKQILVVIGNKSYPIPMGIYKREQYLEVVRIAKLGLLPETWGVFAEMIGVDMDTLKSWRNTEPVKRALTLGITKAYKEMKKAGKKDWRMWREAMKLAGVEDVQQIDHTSQGEKLVQVQYVMPEKPKEENDHV